jgi:DMSO/TMAO reductase YedYZ heme-binding membrane subunit
MNGKLWWYTARSGGIVAWALLATSVLWGLALSTKVLRGKPRPNWILDLHRFLGGLALIFTGIHVVAILLDSFVHFGLVSVLVPFTGNWHPVAVAWGIIGLYLLAAIEVTSLARKHLSKKVWRATHYLSFPLFALTTIHALSAGTDRSTFILRWGVIAVVIIVSALTAIRINKADHHDVLTSPPSDAPTRERVSNR